MGNKNPVFSTRDAEHAMVSLGWKYLAVQRPEEQTQKIISLPSSIYISLLTPFIHGWFYPYVSASLAHLICDILQSELS